MPASTMASCRGRPSSPAGSLRNPGNPNQRVSSFFGSCRSRHHSQAGLAQATSRRFRTIAAAPGNWCLTHGGITELPPDTDNQARVYAISQPPILGSDNIPCNAVLHTRPKSKCSMARRASASTGRVGRCRVRLKTLTRTVSSPAVVNQW